MATRRLYQTIIPPSFIAPRQQILSVDASTVTTDSVLSLAGFVSTTTTCRAPFTVCSLSTPYSYSQWEIWIIWIWPLKVKFLWSVWRARVGSGETVSMPCVYCSLKNSSFSYDIRNPPWSRAPHQPTVIMRMAPWQLLSGPWQQWSTVAKGW